MPGKITHCCAGIDRQTLNADISASLPCIRCSNIASSLSQNDFRQLHRKENRRKQPLLTRCQRVRLREAAWRQQQDEIQNILEGAHRQPRIPAGQGLLPKAEVFAALTTLPAELIKTALQLFAPTWSAVAMDNPAGGALRQIDAACTRLINQWVPWHSVMAASATPAVAVSTPAVAASTAVAPALLRWRIHQAGDNATLFRQQMNEFLRRINWQADEPLPPALLDQWRRQDIIFLYPQVWRHPRPERAHEEVIRRHHLLHEIAIRDKTMATDGIGAKIIAWGDAHSDHGYTLFKQGIEDYNPFYFLAAGGEAVMGYFLHTLGEAYGGTLLDRQPGESQLLRIQRLMLNVLMPAEPVAAKAFRFNPPKPRPGGRQAVKQLPGTVITHAKTGMTLHSALQSKVDGQRWQLYPLEASRAVALPVGIDPALSRAATRSQNNLWRIEGIDGEHSFLHNAAPQWFILSGDLYHPVNFIAGDGTAELLDGQIIYFHERSQQWKRWYFANAHLHNRVLAILPDGIDSAQLDVQSALVSVGDSQAEVWSDAQRGVQYLKVRTETANNYVAGRLEGNFFTLSDEKKQPVYRQTVVKWQPEQQQWHLAESPFTLLQSAVGQIDLSWLQQILGSRENLIALDNRPGLYRLDTEFFLRWQSDADGVDWFLPLKPTSDPAEYRIVQRGAEAENHFRYLETDARWHYRSLTFEAFFGLPDAVKVLFEPPLTSALSLAEYRYLFFRDEAIYLHTGADSEGRAEYIRVEQDEQDNDLFSLRVPAEQGPDSLWLFRYDEDDEFVLEEQRLCLPRVRRGGEDPCAGPSGIDPPPAQKPEPAKKRLRPGLMEEAETLVWLEKQTRSPDELLLLTDSRAARKRKNLAYALRLQMWMPRGISLSVVARHAGIAVRRVSALLGRLSPEGCYCLVSHPPRVGEADIDYALRLYRLFDGFTPRILADFTGVKEERILARLQRLPFDEAYWFTLHPRHRRESNLDYALRLYQLPEGAARAAVIAAHCGVSELTLRLGAASALPQRTPWFDINPRHPWESDMDYAIRLYQQPHENITIEMISSHTGVSKTSLLQRLGERWKEKLQQDQEVQWLSFYPRYLDESNFDYALRLTQLRDEQALAGMLTKKTVRNNIIAIHAHLTPKAFSSRLHEAKFARQWCNNLPRLPAEQLVAGETRTAMDNKNKLYALRLLKQRHQQQIRKIKTRAIAKHIGATQSQLDSWVRSAKLEWYDRQSRLESEIPFENADERTIQRYNQLYARRLAIQREQDELVWLITDLQLASHAEVTLASFKQAQDPFFILDTQPATLTKIEDAWQPESGLLHLQLKQNPPLLSDPKDPQRSVTREVITSPITVSNMAQIVKGLPKSVAQEVTQRFIQQAQALVDSDGGRQDFFYDEQGEKQSGLLSKKLEIYHNEQAPQLGLQIIAREDFDPYELIGVYTGSWHPDEASFREECRKMGSQSVLTYLWGVDEGVGSVSAWQNANKLALINTARLGGEPARTAEVQNNVGVMYINGRLPAYYTTRKIAKGEALLISYGNYYSATYLIQSALNHDVVRIIARQRRCYFVIKGMGDENSAIFGPDGALKTLPDEARPYILKERLDSRGILRYDAIRPKGGRKIATSFDNENNLYHAMAKAIHPRGGLDIINEEMIKMKQSVADEYASEEPLIKPEPAEGAVNN